MNAYLGSSKVASEKRSTISRMSVVEVVVVRDPQLRSCTCVCTCVRTNQRPPDTSCFLKKEVGDDFISFDGLMEECVRDIFRQVSSEKRVRASHAVCQYLARCKARSLGSSDHRQRNESRCRAAVAQRTDTWDEVELYSSSYRAVS